MNEQGEEQHTPEPWRWDTAGGSEVRVQVTGDIDSRTIALMTTNRARNIVVFEANARRIVACVNNCAGIPTSVLEANNEMVPRPQARPSVAGQEAGK